MTASAKMCAFLNDYFSSDDWLLFCFIIYVGLGHIIVGVDDVEGICGGVVVTYSCRVILMCWPSIFWSEMLPYESKRYFMG